MREGQVANSKFPDLSLGLLQGGGGGSARGPKLNTIHDIEMKFGSGESQTN